MRQLLVLVSAAGVAACASAASANTTPVTTERVIATTDVGTLRATEASSQVIAHLKASPTAAMIAAAVAYHDLGVEVKLSEPQSGLIGNRRFSLYHRFAGAPMSRYLGCGTTTTGPGADSYRITMSLVTTILPEGTGSSVQTTLDAKAEDPSSSQGMLSCLTTGILEQRVNTLIAEKAGQ